MAHRLDAHELIAVATDGGSWESWDTPLSTFHPSEYADELRAVREQTGYDEAVVTGSAMISGYRIALIVGEFGFLGGSIGIDAGRRTADAIRRATREGLPILAMPTSGGTRMQEGTSAFVQMVRITAAVQAHKAAGLLYLVYLRHPTTGGVLASWGSLGHITLAEPGALIGFLGPRVYRTMTGTEFPTGVQTSDNLHEHGIVDAIIENGHIAAYCAAVLDLLNRPLPSSRPVQTASETVADRSSWDRVQSSRDPLRPGVRDLLADPRVRHTRLAGSGESRADNSVVLALARIDGHPCILVGQDRNPDNADGDNAIGVDGLKTARRGIRLAHDLRLPLVTIVDTAGAELSKQAEERGIAGQIARCLAEMVSVPVPTVSVLLGQGAGGAALALLPADRIIATENGWLSPLPPEGASAIVFRDIDHAAEMANKQGIGSTHLAASGVVDVLISETPSVTIDPVLFVHRVIGTLSAELTGLVQLDSNVRIANRSSRYDCAVQSAPA